MEIAPSFETSEINKINKAAESCRRIRFNQICDELLARNFSYSISRDCFSICIHHDQRKEKKRKETSECLLRYDVMVQHNGICDIIVDLNLCYDLIEHLKTLKTK